MIKHSALAATLIGGAMLLFSPSPASATTLAGPAFASPAQVGAVEEVRHRRWHRRESRRYSPRRHGYRYGYRHAPRYRYGRRYHSGPSIGFSFTLPGVGLGLGGSGSAHVQWCASRYRTYDPRTDTYVPRIGVRARCNSPYR